MNKGPHKAKQVIKEKEMTNASVHNALGQHWLIEIQGCSPERLRETAQVERFMRQAAAVAGANIVSGHFHQFNPYGVSGVLVIEESHLTIHTWPEHGYAAVDIFTCSPQLRVRAAIEQLQKDFAADTVGVKVVQRGF